ncbi:hypothetical protein G7046_g3322 [Stylonectria norvegica]|nr:hypothetical protein G7046_g3322 [Stylonectria norvegica]
MYPQQPTSHVTTVDGDACAATARTRIAPSWTGAVATRGRLAGQSSSAPLCHPPVPRPNHQPSAGSPTTSPASSVEPVAETPASTSLSALSERDVVVASRDTRVGSATGPFNSETSAPWVLVDPLFQDMKHSHRQYLAYFATRVCLDLVAPDIPDRNPFRSLVPLTQAHPLLQQVIIAASATHMCNQARPWLAPDSFSRAEAPGSMLLDALAAKHKALQMMPEALQSIDAIGGDVVLAAVLFLINVELIESGKYGWRAHLEGADKIMKVIKPLATRDEDLRNYLMSDLFVYYILSSTFTPLGSSPKVFFQPWEVLSVLGKTANNYFCCPPEILEILLLASQLSNSGAGDDLYDGMLTATAAALFERAQDVDVLGWAQQVSNKAMVWSRFRVGSVHRLAACLYILHSTPSLEAQVGYGVAEGIIDEFYETLMPISDDDPNFKATPWPTFILGASAKTPERQAWVMGRLRRLVEMCPWGFIYTAMDTLQVLWKLEAEGNSSRSWIQTLRDPIMNFLIV